MKAAILNAWLVILMTAVAAEAESNSRTVDLPADPYGELVLTEPIEASPMLYASPAPPLGAGIVPLGRTVPASSAGLVPVPQTAPPPAPTSGLVPLGSGLEAIVAQSATFTAPVVPVAVDPLVLPGFQFVEPTYTFSLD